MPILDQYQRDRIVHLLRPHGAEVVVVYVNTGRAIAVKHGPLMDNGEFYGRHRNDPPTTIYGDAS